VKIWGISDLHLSFSGEKPMDIFGPHWRSHVDRVESAWRQLVASEDVVCLPGDFSWAMRLAEAEPELEWLGRLPGRKVLLRGNHDYWWASASKVRRVLPVGVYALQNDALLLDGVGFAGSRGWVDARLDFRSLCSGLSDERAERREPLHAIRGPEEDALIYRRELKRLEASLRALASGAKRRIALLHFPPTSPLMESTPVTDLLEEYAIEVAVFGHLHGPCAEPFRNPYGRRKGVEYDLVSADFIDFTPALLLEVL
jgi:uncharacterized protein